MEEKQAFITLEDFQKLFRPLTPNEAQGFELKAEIVSDFIRQEAFNVNEDIDKLIENNKLMPSVVKGVCSSILARWISQPTDFPSFNSVDGYDPSTTFYNNTNAGIVVLRRELKSLGLLRQTIIELESRGESDG